jgi:hypothetical protein
VLTTLFDELRSAELGATGRAVVNPTVPVEIPPDIWTSNATAVEVSTGNVLIGETRAFIDVVVAPPASTRSASRSSIDRFIVRFDEAMQAASRRFTLAELVAASRQHLGAISAREVDALRRASGAAWAPSGRGPACVVPTPDELARAARLAAESRT